MPWQPKEDNSDIGGLRSRLPHPRDLKVDAIWLAL